MFASAEQPEIETDDEDHPAEFDIKPSNVEREDDLTLDQARLMKNLFDQVIQNKNVGRYRRHHWRRCFCRRRYGRFGLVPRIVLTAYY